MLKSARTKLEWLLEWLVVVLVGSLVVIVVMAVIYRKLGASLSWYDEVASVLLAWLTYYGAALAALKRAHIGFSGLVYAVPLPYRMALVAVAEVFVIGFFVILGWQGYEVLVVLEGDNLVSLPEVPTRLTQSVIPIGAVLFVAAELLSLPQAWRRARAAGMIDEAAGEETA